jgi:hypothetical protein
MTLEMNLTNEPVRLRIRRACNSEGCLNWSYDMQGASGRPPSPWLGRRPSERQAVTKAFILARRHGQGRGANPRPCRSHKTVTEPDPVTAGRHIAWRPTPRQNDTAICGPPGRDRLSQRITNRSSHRSFYSLACAMFTIAWARRTYLLSARSRTVLTPSVSSRASASLLDRPKAVNGASTSAANLTGPDSVSGGGVVSDLSVKVGRWWLGVRPARARQGRRLEAGHCWGARPWSRVVTRSVVSPGPARGRLHCRR